MSRTLQRHHGRTTPYGRRRALLVAVLALLAAAAFAVPRRLLNGEDRGYLVSDEDRTESGNRSRIGVVLGQQGDNLITAGLDAAGRPPGAERSTPGTSSMSGAAGRLSAGQPGLATPAGAYRRHIENHIRAGNTPLP